MNCRIFGFMLPLALVFLLVLSNPSFALTNISACSSGGPFTFASNEEYVLINDITAGAGTTCLDFGPASNISIDCNGYTINGNQEANTAIRSHMAENVTVKNCIIENFGAGDNGAIHIRTSNNTVVDNITFINNSKGVIVDSDSYGAVISNINSTVISAPANPRHIWIDNAQDIIIENVSIAGGGTASEGIKLGQTAGTNVININITNITIYNVSTGIYAQDTYGAKISFFTITGNNIGAFFNNSQAIQLWNITASQNGLSSPVGDILATYNGAILIQNVPIITMNNITAYNNSIGIRIDNTTALSPGDVLIDNSVLNRNHYGIFENASANIQIMDVNVSNSTYAGIMLLNSNNTIFSGLVDLTDNRWNFYIATNSETEPQYYRHNTGFPSTLQSNGKQIAICQDSDLGNTVFDGSVFAMLVLLNCSNAIVENMSASNNSHGIYIYGSENITLSYFNATDVLTGVETVSSKNITVRNAIITNVIMPDELANSTPYNESSISPQPKGVHNIGSLNDSVFDNITINNITMIGFHNTNHPGLSYRVNITNMKVTNTGSAISSENSSYYLLENITIDEYNPVGLFLAGAENFTINNMIINNASTLGIVLGDTYNISFSNLIVNNSAFDDPAGIGIIAGMVGSNDNLTTIRHSLLRNSSMGMFINSENLIIDNLTGTENSNYSLILYDTFNFMIANSFFYNDSTMTTDPFNPFASIVLMQSGNGMVENTTIENNSVKNASGIVVWNSNSILFNNITLRNDSGIKITAGYEMPAALVIYPNTDNITINNSLFSGMEDNTIENAGLVAYGNSSNISILNSVFKNHLVGISMREGTNETLTGNLSYFLGYVTEFNIINNSIYNNTFFGLKADGCYHNISDNNIINNSILGFYMSNVCNSHVNNNTINNSLIALTVGTDDDRADGLTNPRKLADVENEITVSNTIDGRPVYYYSAFAGNVPAPGFIAPLDGGFYGCADCDGVIFENLTVKNVSHAVFIAKSKNMIVRNISGETWMGIHFYASNDSQAYNNTLTITPGIVSFLSLLPEDFYGNARGFGITHSQGITAHDSEVTLTSTGSSIFFSNNIELYNLTISNLYTSNGIALFATNNSAVKDTTMLNLSGVLTLSNPEAGLLVSNGSGNLFRNVNITTVNVSGGSRAYYMSLWNSSLNTAENITIENTAISFTDHDIAITNASQPAPDPSNGINIGKFVNITNTSADSYVTLTFHYSDSDIPSGSSESNLKIWKYSDSSATWTMLPSAVDSVNNKVTATINNFASVFAPLITTFATPRGGTEETLTISASQSCNPEQITILVTGDGQPIFDAHVAVSKDSQIIAAGRTNSKGIFSFKPERGTYTITIEAGAIGFNPNSKSFSVKECLPLLISYFHECNPDSIIVRVVNGNGGLVEGASLLITNSVTGERIASGTTNAAGQYTFTAAIPQSGLPITINATKSGNYIPGIISSTIEQCPPMRCTNICGPDTTQNPYPDCSCIPIVKPPKEEENCTAAIKCTNWGPCTPTSPDSTEGIMQRSCYDSNFCDIKQFGIANISVERKKCEIEKEQPPTLPQKKTVLEEVSDAVFDIVSSPQKTLLLLLLLLIILGYLYYRKRFQKPAAPAKPSSAR